MDGIRELLREGTVEALWMWKVGELKLLTTDTPVMVKLTGSLSSWSLHRLG